MVQTDVFKFVALRPPVSINRDDLAETTIKDEREPAATPVGEVVHEVGANSKRVIALLQQTVDRTGWTPELPESERSSVLAQLADYFTQEITDFDTERFECRVTEILGESPESVGHSEWLTNLKNELWDRLYAFYILNRAAPVNVEQLMLGLRVIHVIEYIANGEVVYSGSKLEKLFTATTLLPELIVNLQRPELVESSRDPAQNPATQQRTEQYVRLWNEYATTYDALEEVKRLRTETRSTSTGVEEETSEQSGIPNTPIPSPDVASFASEGESPRQGSTLDVQVSPLRVESFESRPIVLEQEFQNLSVPTRSILQDMRIDHQTIDLPPLVNDLQEKLSNLTTIIHSIDDRGLIDVIPEKVLHIPGIMALRKAINSPLPLVFSKAAPVAAPVKVLGIGDLKVVKQTLEKYVAGEVAHIENVLKGESKERKHRRFDRTEEIITIAQETTEETERDTQTTDRFELKKESERTIQSDMSIGAGITVSASYGPVELGAYANFAYSTSSQETTKNASNFARDVVDRSLTRIQKKIREERITKTIHEVEEINTHGLDNRASTENITGIYRWVDKHYKAQLYNYGKRLMLEFIVPEPAAFYIFAQENNPAKAINVDKPQPLGSLTHKDISDFNYQTYVSRYKVQGVTPPPPFYKVIALTFDQSEMAEKSTSSKSSRELVVPDGYEAIKKWSISRARWWADDYDLKLQIGSRADGSLINEESVIPVAIQTYNVAAYAVTIEVRCQRTVRFYEIWQIQTFENIMAAYQKAQAEYEDKLRAAETARGIVISGRNPRFNREIEENELKKHCVSILTGERYTNFNAMGGNPPEIDLADAQQEGTFIQFFEQAFEWEQMTYLFYPYFWGRKNNWIARSNLFDNDPLFTKFLQAGSARIVLPVHPAYRDAILYFMETGAIWNGGDAPRLDDPLYIALHEELKAQQDDLANAVTEGDPWQVILPTTLVYLQADNQLPDFTP